MFIAKIIFNGPLNLTFINERSPVLRSLTFLCRCIAEYLCICYPMEVMPFESTSGWFGQHSAGKLCILSFIWRVLGCIPPTLISLKTKYTPSWQQHVMTVASLNRKCAHSYCRNCIGMLSRTLRRIHCVVLRTKLSTFWFH